MPGVVRLLDYVETRDSYYIVMETQTRSIDLFDFISAAGTLPEDVAREIFGQVSCDWWRLERDDPTNPCQAHSTINSPQCQELMV